MTLVPKAFAAGLLIYRRQPGAVEYLLMQASYGKHHWTPPKGHVDPGEDLRTAAVREALEESGLNNEIDYAIDEGWMRELQYTTKGNERHPAEQKSVTYWLAELVNPNAEVQLSDEHTNYGWFPLAEAKEKASKPDFVGMLDEAELYLSQQH